MTVVKKNANKILKTYLKNHGIKQSFVAREMGLRPSNFGDRLNGRLKFTADFAIRASSVLKISPNIFLKFDNPKRAKKKEEV